VAEKEDEDTEDNGPKEASGGGDGEELQLELDGEESFEEESNTQRSRCS